MEQFFLRVATTFFVFSLLIFFSPPVISANIHYQNASQNKTAQALFDIGMLNYYGYLYVQAEYDFRLAIEEDPFCGICYTGLALAKKQQALELNKPFATIGYDDAQKALQLLSAKNTFQYDVAHAVMASFSLDPQASSKQLQTQYINALREIYQKYKNNSEWREESMALFVDALFYYSSVDSTDTVNHCGRPLNENYRREALDLLTPVLTNPNYPDHPGLLHTYIHIAERQLNDPIGLLAAKKLPEFAEGQIAHYAHMPNHIYWRRGMYSQAIQANLNAIAIDHHYFNVLHGVGLNSYYYEFHYLHSYQFLAVLGVLTNNYSLSIHYARELKKLMDSSRLQSLPDYRDVYLSLEHLILARFQKWQALLQIPVPAQTQDLGLLFIHFSQALAYLHLGQEQKFDQLYQQINKTHYSSAIIDYQRLVLSYLQAAKMDFHHASLSVLAKIFTDNNIDKIEAKIFSANPPVWFFPHQLFLAEAAFTRGDIKAEKMYYAQCDKIYPHATWGTFIR